MLEDLECIIFRQQINKVAYRLKQETNAASIYILNYFTTPYYIYKKGLCKLFQKTFVHRQYF